MLVATEVATPAHVFEALKAGIDILWVGARTVTNPFAMQELADALKGVVIEYFSGHKFQDLTKLVIPKKGLFDLCEFIDFLHTNLKAKNLEELQIPLIITATDLDHGRMVHFHRGSIAERVAASCCMPVMFAPVNIDGTKNGSRRRSQPICTGHAA